MRTALVEPYAARDETFTQNARSPVARLLQGTVLVSVVLSRLPLLPCGYGDDPDAWRVARSAWTLWNTGHYEVSRFPGFPLHEILMAPVISWGAIATNISTLAATILAILAWRSLTARTTRHPALMFTAFAVMPLIIVNAACTMDYVWSLLCILLALRSALRQNVIHSGLWTGLAAGFRLPNGIAIIPVAVLLFAGNREANRMILFSVVTIATTAIACVPIFAAYGFSGWLDGLRLQFSDTSLPLVEHLMFGLYRGVYAIGLIPAAVVLMLTLRSWKKHHQRFDPLVRAGMAGLVSFLVLFLFFPFQREYLIPALPFLLLLLDRISERTWMQVFVFSVLSYAFVNIDIVRHHGVKGDPGFNIHPGLVVEEWRDRHLLLAERSTLPRRAFSTPTVVMTGLEDAFTFDNDGIERDTLPPWTEFQKPAYHSRRYPDVHFITVLLENEVTDLMNAHFTVYYHPSRKEYIQSLVRYDFRKYPISSLPGD